MNLLKKIAISTLILMAACGPSELKTTASESSDTEVADPYPWATWETCSHNLGDNPCNFSLIDHTGKTVELYQFYGKVIVVDFSTMWCGVCRNIARKGDEWTSEFGRDKFVWLTVLIEDEAGSTVEQQDLSTWINTYNITVPVLAGDRSMIDTTETLESGYPITGWPTLVVIDQAMVLQHGINGWNEEVVKNWAASLL